MMHESQDKCRSRANSIYQNVALFGLTVKQQRDANPARDSNMHEHATLEQLLLLANIGSLHAVFIHRDLPQDDRLKQLNDIATRHPPDETAHRDRLAF